MHDLSICMRVAEIEGVEYLQQGYVVIVNYNGSGEVKDWEEFNPLTDDALCFMLMKKYEISLYKENDIEWSAEYGCDKGEQAISTTPNKAICLAIIEAHKETNNE